MLWRTYPRIPAGRISLYRVAFPLLVWRHGHHSHSEVKHGARCQRRASGAGRVGTRLGPGRHGGGARAPRRRRRGRPATPGRAAGRRWPGRACSACTCPRSTAARATASASWRWPWRSWAAPWSREASCPRCWPAPAGPGRYPAGNTDTAKLLAGLADGSRTGAVGVATGLTGTVSDDVLTLDGESAPVLGGGLADLLILPVRTGCERARTGDRTSVGRGRRRGPDHHRAGQPGPDPPAGHGPRQPASGCPPGGSCPASTRTAGHVADRRAVRGGSVRHRGLGGADGGGLRPDPAPVRPADRPVPGGQAPVRPDAHRGRAGRRGHAGTPPARAEAGPRTRMPASFAAAVAAVVALDAAVAAPTSASRSSAGSATPGNTPPTCTTGGPCRCGRCSARPRTGPAGSPSWPSTAPQAGPASTCPRTPSRCAPGSGPSWPRSRRWSPRHGPPGWPPAAGWSRTCPRPGAGRPGRWSSWSSRRR